MVQHFRNILLIALLAVLCSCSATRLTGSWVNPKYQGKRFHKILVLGTCRNETYLRIFEDSMSNGLLKRGVEAVPGYTLFPPEKRPDKASMIKELAGEGFDAMIISQMAGKRTEEVVHPGYTYFRGEPPYYYRDWYDYYSRSYDILHEPAYISTYQVVTVQSNMYDTENDNLIWSAVSETVVDGNVQAQIDSLVNSLIKGMADKGLL